MAAAPGLTLGQPAMNPALARTSAEPGGVGLMDHPIRAPGADEVELRISLCGLCGSDVIVYRADPAAASVPLGMVLGHESVGSVVRTGLLVPDWLAPGTRVVPISTVGCGHCAACLADQPHLCAKRSGLGLTQHGQAAARALVPWRNLVPVPDSVPDTTAVLAEPASIAWRAVSTVAGIQPGERVAVSTTRSIGLLAGLMAQRAGATVTMIGREGPGHAARVELAASLGLGSTTGQRPDTYDVWIEATGAGLHLGRAVQELRPLGRLVMVAMYASGTAPAPVVRTSKKLDVLHSFISIRPDFEQALAFLATLPDLGERLITTYPMDRAVEALRVTADGSTDVAGRPLIKAVLKPNL
ncbi:MAG: zinc-dependent alcohol dehydrogenase [Actinomycetota bacterium]